MLNLTVEQLSTPEGHAYRDALERFLRREDLEGRSLKASIDLFDKREGAPLLKRAIDATPSAPTAVMKARDPSDLDQATALVEDAQAKFDAYVAKVAKQRNDTDLMRVSGDLGIKQDPEWTRLYRGIDTARYQAIKMVENDPRAPIIAKYRALIEQHAAKMRSTVEAYALEHNISPRSAVAQLEAVSSDYRADCERARDLENEKLRALGDVDLQMRRRITTVAIKNGSNR